MLASFWGEWELRAGLRRAPACGRMSRQDRSQRLRTSGRIDRPTDGAPRHAGPCEGRGRHDRGTAEESVFRAPGITGSSLQVFDPNGVYPADQCDRTQTMSRPTDAGDPALWKIVTLAMRCSMQLFRIVRLTWRSRNLIDGQFFLRRSLLSRGRRDQYGVPIASCRNRNVAA